MTSTMHLSPDRGAYYPHLTTANHTITSAETPAYNCIAWAYGIDNRRMWPAAVDYWWPDGIRSDESLEAFIELFESIGYEACDTGDPEDGHEKIAIYVSDDGPEHAARQLPSGRWSSKLGQWEDIEHATPESVECALYGTVAVFMRRSRTTETLLTSESSPLVVGLSSI